MTVLNFDLDDGLPPVSFTLFPNDAARFMRFMKECSDAKSSVAVASAGEPAAKDALRPFCQYAKDIGLSDQHCGDCLYDPDEVASRTRTVVAQYAAGWIGVEDAKPEEGIAVWASVDLPSPFNKGFEAKLCRYVEVLGWQPLGSTGWDYVVSHWMYPPIPPVAHAAPVAMKSESDE